jgi:HEAT repeat protein
MKIRSLVRLSRKAIVLWIAIAIVVALFGYRQSRQPSYSGRPLRVWLMYADSLEQRERDAADAAIRAMRAEAAPILLDLALSREPAWRRRLLAGRKSLPRLFRFVDWFGIQPRDGQRYRAAIAFRALGPYAQSSMPELVGALKSEDGGVRYRALIALSGVGSPAAGAIPDVLACFHDQDRIVRDQAAYALGKFGAAGISSVDRCLRDRDPEIRRLALSALDSMVTFDPRCCSRWGETDVLGSLLWLLRDGDVPSRRSAAGLLALIDPDRRRAVPALVRARSDVDGEVRFRAEMALQSLGAISQPITMPVRSGLALESDRSQGSPIWDRQLFPETDHLSLRLSTGELPHASNTTNGSK